MPKPSDPRREVLTGLLGLVGCWRGLLLVQR